MTTDNRSTILKEAVTLLLKNLVNADWVGIVIFETDATTYNSKLVRATSDNITKLINYVKGNEPRGSTNYQAAFSAANNLLRDSIYDENNSPCKTFIMFLTDGSPTTGLQSQSELTAHIDSLDYLKKAIIFSYSLGSGSAVDIPKAFACMRGGIFETIDNVSDLNKKMNSYFVALSLGMNVTKALWVEPYIDASGLGEMTTCSIPVYDRSVTPIRLIGVIGIDILMDTFYKVETSKDVITKKLISKSMSACTNSDATECQINTLRDENYRCSVYDGSCNMVQIDWTTCPNALSNVFCNTMRSGVVVKDSCCSTTPQTCTKSQIIDGFFAKLNILAFIMIILFLV